VFTEAKASATIAYAYRPWIRFVFPKQCHHNVVRWSRFGLVELTASHPNQRGSTMRYTARSLGRLAFAVLVVVCSAAGATAQSLTVTASAGAASPNPTCVNQQITSALSASVSNPPTAPYPCTLQAPTWSWSIVSVQYSTDGTSWSSTGTGGVWINHPDPASPNATLIGQFSQGGYYQITVQATVTYTDYPCYDVWSASGTASVTMTAVSVSFSPDPVSVPIGGTATVTATVIPSSVTLSYDTADDGVAIVQSVSGTTITLFGQGLGEGGAGTTQIRGKLGTCICGTGEVTTFCPN